MPLSARCTRIWCVRPVSSVHSTCVAPRERLDDAHVRDRALAARTRVVKRSRSRRVAPVERRERPRLGARRRTIASYARSIECAWNCAFSASRARGVRATTMTPLVPLSSRCTMPGRTCPAASPSPNVSASSSLRKSPSARRPFTSVPASWPRAGCTTSRPACSRRRCRRPTWRTSKTTPASGSRRGRARRLGVDVDAVALAQRGARRRVRRRRP